MCEREGVKRDEEGETYHVLLQFWFPVTNVEDYTTTMWIMKLFRQLAKNARYGLDSTLF